jgi:anti-sigma B factor antagonist
MNIQQRTVGDVVIVSVTGDITMAADGATRLSDRVRRLLQEGQSRIVIDLAHVRYVDSSGLGDLVQAFTAAKTRGGAVKLIHVGKRLNDLLVVTRLLTVFDCYDAEPDALNSFAAPVSPV